MAKDLKEQIEIMTHYLNGGDVECSEDGFKTVLCTADKERDGDLSWNWDDFKYRIKEQKQKVTIETWLMQSTIDKEYRIIETSLVDKVVNFKKVKLIESYEVEL